MKKEILMNTKYQANLMKKLLILIVGTVFGTLSIAYASCQVQEEVIIFHAGSLEAPFAQIEKGFETEYPAIDVIRKSGGSLKMARMISEQHEPADIMASADYTVIDNLLIPDSASWNIRFASNQLVLCFTENSKFADEVNADTWYEILTREHVSWAHTDPNLDPCGYRSLMVLQLAEKYYEKPGLYAKLLSLRPEEHVFNSTANMVDVLKAGKIDYAWEYLSVAVQNGLKYLVLPDEINLGDYEHDADYEQASLTVTGKESGTWTTLTAKSITYGITMTRRKAPTRRQLFFSYNIFLIRTKDYTC